MTPEVIKTLIEIANEQQRVMAAKLYPLQWTERFAHTPKIGQCM